MKKTAFVLMLALICTSNVFAAKFKPMMYCDAEAVIKVQPDRVLLNFTVSEKGADISAAKEKVMTQTAQAVAFLTGNGVLKNNITADFITADKLAPEAGKKTDIYNVEQNISAVIDDMAKYDAVFDGIVNIKGVSVTGVEPQLKDNAKYKEQARKLAVEAAKAKARQLAGLAGLTLADTTNVSETNMRYLPPVQTKNPNLYQQSDVYLDLAEDVSKGAVYIRSIVVVNFEIK